MPRVCIPCVYTMPSHTSEGRIEILFFRSTPELTTMHGQLIVRSVSHFHRASTSAVCLTRHGLNKEWYLVDVHGGNRYFSKAVSMSIILAPIPRFSRC
eukprot:m.886494 g.886494  ORF g.886494 m.886494 type:complete len:98 (+) comp23625_c0_seq13:2034-2327(+)